METKFITITQNDQHELDIKKSRFIANGFRIKTEQEATKFIAEIKSLHHKANHHCFAYMLGVDDHIQRASDDGEPSGTAGVPILEVLQKNHVHNTLVVVTRYFGGIKLGAGGLIRAYSNATSQLLEQTGLVNRVEQTLLHLTITYAQLDQLTHWLKTHAYQIQDTKYTDQVVVAVAVTTHDVDSFQEALKNLFRGQIAFQPQGTQYNEIPFKNDD
ncbi:YigZ family protein [Pediococcus cellicola]|uniref:YigZ family protein n=1 Tax=Pediococcus cellicola TaxID=319652 RepID=A0A0R2INZ0_9LACO|nr:YigZ family protein [Pediococcus cellicola]KRN66719.1 hypothetical protein IV80_GL001310 [Pediococcus cellicola]GEL14637.1 YigZ family protein [Pediococcus cellicola]